MRLALELGLRDYVEKNGFGDVVVGISGGIDSALTAALAAEALGPDRVHCVSMPSPFTSDATRGRRVGRGGVTRRRLPEIPSTRSRCLRVRASPASPAGSATRPRRTSRRGCGARCSWRCPTSSAGSCSPRGTSRSSRSATATLYGDMAGGFALLKDVFKTDVWRLARHLNERAGQELIPASIIERAPSAELRPGQLDEDSLPRYHELDPCWSVRRARPLEGGARRRGRRRGVVARVVSMVDRAEYKRRQAPPGVKLRPKAFGRDRRMPITNRWTG